VSYPAIISLAESENIPKSVLGEIGSYLLQLSKAEIPIVPTFIVTPETLHKLVHKDEDTQIEVLKFYHRVINNDFIDLYFINPTTNQLEQVTNVHGDTNLIQNLQQIAAQAHHQPIVIQYWPRPSFSGVAWTRNQQTGNKTQVEIWSVPGVFSENTQPAYDRFVVDSRTATIVENITSPHTLSWKRSLDHLVSNSKSNNYSSPPSQYLKQIASFAMSIKRQFFVDQKIHWSINDGKLEINTTHKVNQPETDASQNHSLLAMGNSLITGYVEGYAFFPDNPHSHTSQLGSILVCHTLTKNHLNMIKNANGIIVEETIRDHQVLKLITEFHIPTVINARHALKKIPSHLPILLDAGNGKVWLELNKKSSTNPTNSREVTVYITNINQLTPQAVHLADNVLISSNNWFFSLEKRPLQLTKEFKRHFISTAYEEIQHITHTFSHKLFYQFCSLNTHQRTQLGLNEPYESNGYNPDLAIRGTAHLLQHLDLLDLELESLIFTLHTLQKKQGIEITPSLVFPFVTSIEDAVLLNTIIQQKLPNVTYQTWVHLTSVETLLDTVEYQSWHPHGIIIDLDYLLASWHGQDPHLDLAKKTTTYQNSHLWGYLQTCLSKLSLPVYVFSRHLTPALASRVRELRSNGIITAPTHLAAARIE
jgi:phosphohistidine swiveling domain-containing protein